jgi:predicted peptidase
MLCGMKSLAVLVAAVALLTGCAKIGNPIHPASGVQIPMSFTATVTKTNHLDYLLYLPKNYYADHETRFPLVLFLHGAGERGTNLAVVAKHGPPKLVAAGREFPFILASPQCPEGQVWDDDALLSLVDTLQAQLRVDARRIYVTGLSMGGYGTWSLASKHPERFAAVAPVCGGGERIRTLLPTQREALKTLGVWAFHGGKDNVVALSESERMVDAFKKAGVTDIQLTVYPEDGHDSWTHAYNEPTFYDWLLKHSR